MTAAATVPTPERASADRCDADRHRGPRASTCTPSASPLLPPMRAARPCSRPATPGGGGRTQTAHIVGRVAQRRAHPASRMVGVRDVPRVLAARPGAPAPGLGGRVELDAARCRDGGARRMFDVAATAAVDSAGSITTTKKFTKRAFESSFAGRGLSFVDVLIMPDRLVRAKRGRAGVHDRHVRNDVPDRARSSSRPRWPRDRRPVVPRHDAAVGCASSRAVLGRRTHDGP